MKYELGKVGEDLEKKIIDIKEYVGNLPMEDEHKTNIYVAIRERKILISPMKLSEQQIARINQLATGARSQYEVAHSVASSYPTFRDCDEYAHAEADNIWQTLN